MYIHIYSDVDRLNGTIYLSRHQGTELNLLNVILKSDNLLKLNRWGGGQYACQQSQKS